MVTRAVSSNNRIAVPPDYWKQIGVTNGVNVDIYVKNHTIVIRKSKNTAGIGAQVEYLKNIIQNSNLPAQDEMLKTINIITELMNSRKDEG